VTTGRPDPRRPPARREEQWHELADLPFAAALAPHPGSLSPGETYDGAHFDHLSVDHADAAGSRFLECAFTHVSFQGGQLRRATFTDVWLRDVRLVATGLAETTWGDAVFSESAIAGAEAFGAQLRRVIMRGCKLDSVNFRGAVLADVTFDNCLLREVDFTDAALTRTAFPRSRLTGTEFTRVTMDAVDLRGAELGITVDPGSLRGAIVTPAQLADMAALLADSLGIKVQDQ
jgi:uncharacterized protein YjbI with pentapeptide repeats